MDVASELGVGQSASRAHEPSIKRPHKVFKAFAEAIYAHIRDGLQELLQHQCQAVFAGSGSALVLEECGHVLEQFTGSDMDSADEINW